MCKFAQLYACHELFLKYPIIIRIQTESYSLHVMQLIRILSTEEYFYFPHLVMWGRYCACEILIANVKFAVMFGF
jgi:hypothetical protein